MTDVVGPNVCALRCDHPTPEHTRMGGLLLTVLHPAILNMPCFRLYRNDSEVLSIPRSPTFLPNQPVPV